MRNVALVRDHGVQSKDNAWIEKAAVMAMHLKKHGVLQLMMLNMKKWEDVSWLRSSKRNAVIPHITIANWQIDVKIHSIHQSQILSSSPKIMNSYAAKRMDAVLQDKLEMAKHAVLQIKNLLAAQLVKHGVKKPKPAWQRNNAVMLRENLTNGMTTSLQLSVVMFASSPTHCAPLLVNAPWRRIAAQLVLNGVRD